MIKVSKEIENRVIQSYGRFFERIAHVPAEKCARDVLDEEKVHDQIALFCQTFGLTPHALQKKRFLEIGSGFGIFLAVLRRDYGVESFGVEPASIGFESSYIIGREIIRGYGLDPEIVTAAFGEKLPFPDQSFDFVFSSTVLEHTQNPSAVLSESLRVLKLGGAMQFVYPNYGAFFEGHYALPWIPYMNRALGKLWVTLWRRDSAFIDTLQLTNFFKTRGWVKKHSGFRVITYGEKIFQERMLGRNIKTWAGLGRLKRALDLADRLRLVPLITMVLLRMKSFDPILFSIVKVNAVEENRLYPVR
jgi:SAM-dependent methyltransferase